MDYLKRLDDSKDELIRRLSELAAIRSVVEASEGDMPFGSGVQEAFEYFLKLGAEEGFEVCNIDNYGGHLDFGGWIYDEEGNLTGRNEETLGILVHLDVVPEGDGWTYPPYEPCVVDGKLYGRGMEDDKGPAMAVFFALKALKDAGFRPKKKIRLILGLDEEVDWVGMKHYLSKVKAPDFSFTPDADFPVIHGEKGIMVFELARKFGASREKGLVLRSISGGTAPNSVADRAKALLNGPDYDDVKAKLAAFRERTGYTVSCKGRGKSLEITAEGAAAHGATPWEGLNAISVLMAFLGELNIVNEDVRDFIRFYNDKIGFELDGASIGCKAEDECSGGLVFNVGMIQMDEEAVRVTVNIRYPISLTCEDVYEAMMPELNRSDIGVVKQGQKDPIFTPEDSPLVQTLLRVYRKHTGDEESRPQVIGGGTYARAVPNAVAFGALFPGTKETMHQRDEHVEIDKLMAAAKIYAEAIYELTK